LFILLEYKSSFFSSLDMIAVVIFDVAMQREKFGKWAEPSNDTKTLQPTVYGHSRRLYMPIGAIADFPMRDAFVIEGLVSNDFWDCKELLAGTGVGDVERFLVEGLNTSDLLGRQVPGMMGLFVSGMIGAEVSRMLGEGVSATYIATGDEVCLAVGFGPEGATGIGAGAVREIGRGAVVSLLSCCPHVGLRSRQERTRANTSWS
jgi:hypothetical protein